MPRSEERGYLLPVNGRNSIGPIFRRITPGARGGRDLILQED